LTNTVQLLAEPVSGDMPPTALLLKVTQPYSSESNSSKGCANTLLRLSLSDSRSLALAVQLPQGVALSERSQNNAFGGHWFPRYAEFPCSFLCLRWL